MLPTTQPIQKRCHFSEITAEKSAVCDWHANCLGRHSHPLKQIFPTDLPAHRQFVISGCAQVADRARTLTEGLQSVGSRLICGSAAALSINSCSMPASYRYGTTHNCWYPHRIQNPHNQSAEVRPANTTRPGSGQIEHSFEFGFDGVTVAGAEFAKLPAEQRRGDRQQPVQPDGRGHAQPGRGKPHVGGQQDDIRSQRHSGNLTGDERHHYVPMFADGFGQADSGPDFGSGQVIKREGQQNDFAFSHGTEHRPWRCTLLRQGRAENQKTGLRVAADNHVISSGSSGSGASTITRTCSAARSDNGASRCN